MTRRFVILDRDGTVIFERHYLSEPEQVELIPGAASALRQLGEMGLGLVVATNQSGIGRGFFDEERVAQVHRRLEELLLSDGVRLDGIYYCPHLPGDRCRCRKPEPGLVERASQELGFEMRSSFVVGDKPCDTELGARIGATSILVRTGYGAALEAEDTVSADYVIDGLADLPGLIARLAAQEASRTT